MKKIIFIVLMITGCGGGSTDNFTPEIKADNLYIVAGQSNAKRCDWSYFEEMTGSKVINIAVGGYSIERLIKEYDNSNFIGTKPKGIIFVHGESDSVKKTNVKHYSNQVEQYRKLISNDVKINLPLYISTVGYYHKIHDVSFDALRKAVIEQSKENPLWLIAYDEAKNFRDWGLLPDNLHFSETGCQLMMEGIAAFI